MCPNPPARVVEKAGFHYSVELYPRRAEPSKTHRVSTPNHPADFVAIAESPTSTLHGWFLPPENLTVHGLRAVHQKKTFAARRNQLRPDVFALHPDRPDSLRSGFRIEVNLQRGWNHFVLQYKDAQSQWQDFGHVAIRRPLLSFNLPIFMSKSKSDLELEYQPSPHEQWSRAHGDPAPSELQAMVRFLDRFPSKPLLSVLLPTYNTPIHWLRRTIESIQEQIYPHWELCIADDCSPQPAVRRLLNHYARSDSRIKLKLMEAHGHICQSSNAALELCNGAYTVLLDHDDEVPRHALFHIAWEAASHPTSDIIFTDEDKIDLTGSRFEPYFKSGWNYDLLLTQNCVSHLGAYRTELLRDIGGFRVGYEGSQDWDLALRAYARSAPDRVRHIPRILYHWRTLEASTASTVNAKPYAFNAGRRSIEEHLHQTCPGAVIQDTPNHRWRILWPLPEPAPLASLIVATDGPLHWLQNLIESHIKHAAPTPTERLLIAHPGTHPETQDYLEHLITRHPGCRLLHLENTGVAALNLAAAAASGDLLIFLHPGAEITQSDWLDELIRQTSRDGIGAVGGAVINEDDSLQYGSLAINPTTLATHAFRHWPVTKRTITSPPHSVQEVSALPLACLAVRKECFQRVQGFNETLHSPLAAALDFSLKLREINLRNLFTPHSQLLVRKEAQPHFQGYDQPNPQDIELLVTRWKTQLSQDPFFNPNLSIHCTVPIAAKPSTSWPWQ
ncbi:glycosyltransferase family 2 protein [Phragmitibacter flavus]|nr:glycosyltransferase [Phragmitibacter flavus]